MGNLNQNNIRECQSKFSLSYHVSFAHNCQQLVGFAGKDVLEVGGSLPKEFVLDYLQAKSWSAMETPDYDEALAEVGGSPHQGTAFDDIIRTSRRDDLGFRDRDLERYNLFIGKVEELPEEHYQKYDLIFSIAAFEHIHKMPQALEKMYLALRPGGKVFSMFCPIWSAPDGHHIPAVTDKQGVTIERGGENCPIPDWGHLTMRPPEMCAHLYQYTDRETADLLVYYIYNSDHINRFFLEDHLQFVEQSPFLAEILKPIYPRQAAPDAIEKLKRLYPGDRDFLSNGLMMVLAKPEEHASAAETLAEIPDETPTTNTGPAILF
ncbi:MAG: class I SAM-dependent methyltransferase [Geitlerinemataceae cyanobacterium]